MHILIIFVQSVLAPMTKVDPYLSSSATSHHVSILAIFAQFRLWLLPCLRQRVFSTSSQFSSLDSSDRDKRPLSRPNLSHNASVSHDPNSIILDLTGPDSEAGWSAGDTPLSYQLSTVFNSANSAQQSQPSCLLFQRLYHHHHNCLQTVKIITPRSQLFTQPFLPFRLRPSFNNPIISNIFGASPPNSPR